MAIQLQTHLKGTLPNCYTRSHYSSRAQGRDIALHSTLVQQAPNQHIHGLSASDLDDLDRAGQGNCLVAQALRRRLPGGDLPV